MKWFHTSVVVGSLLPLWLTGSGVSSDTYEGSKKEWGIYEMLTRRYSWEERLDDATKELGAKPQFVLFFRDLNPRRAFPDAQVKSAHARNITPVISLEISEWGRGRDNIRYLEGVAAGEYDDYFRQWAKDAKTNGRPLILRFGFEMNGDWFAWGSQPETFVIAWRRTYNLFKEIGADNVQWMFSPNVLWDNRTEKKDFYNYYPGAAYVDLIGLDGYNFGDHHDRWHVWQTYEEVFERTIRASLKFNKPIYLSEIGCADDKRKPAWIRDFLGKVSEDDRLEGFIYFNHFNHRKGEPNWRFDSDPETLKIFREWAAENEAKPGG